MTTTFVPLALDALVDLVNGWGAEPRAAAAEQDLPFPPLPALLAGAGLNDAGADEGAARQVADLVHAVFAARRLGDQQALTQALLERTTPRPVLRQRDGRPEAAWTADRATALLAAAALGLRDHLAGQRGVRLGICAAERCVDVFVDRSPGKARRYCSLRCQTRARVAEHRRRQRTA